MTHRAEFLPLPPKEPPYYRTLIKAAERVLHYQCQCAHPNEKTCVDCIYGLLRLTLKQIQDEQNRMGEGRG
jgi:hypothetical protein